MKDHRPWIVVALAILSGCSSSAGTPHPRGTGGIEADAGPGGLAGITGSGGTSVGSGGTSVGSGGRPGTGGIGGGAVDPPTDAMPPHHGDGGITPVGTTPPAAWTNVTANLA